MLSLIHPLQPFIPLLPCLQSRRTANSQVMIFSRAVIEIFFLALNWGLPAICLDAQGKDSPAVVGLKIQRSPNPRSYTGDRLQRRQGVTVQLDNEVITTFQLALNFLTPFKAHILLCKSKLGHTTSGLPSSGRHRQQRSVAQHPFLTAVFLPARSLLRGRYL